MSLIRKIVKLGLAVLFYYAGLLALFAFFKRTLFPIHDVVILMYHRVLDDDKIDNEYTQPGIVVSRQVFEKQITYLAKNYNLISLENLVQMVQKNQPIPSRSVIVTFDDGWRDNYLYAYPILKKHRVPATIFLTTDYIDTNKVFWFLQANILLTKGNLKPASLAEIIERVNAENRASQSTYRLSRHEIKAASGDTDKFIEKMKQLDSEVVQKILNEIKKASDLSIDKCLTKRRMLSWDEIKEMSCDNIDFGSHGQSHQIMLFLSPDMINKELVQSKKIIEEKVGKEVKHFSYPNGDYNSITKKLVQDAGYGSAATIQRCEENKKGLDLFALKRIGVHNGMSVWHQGKFSRALFAVEINGWINFLRKIFKLKPTQYW